MPKGYEPHWLNVRIDITSERYNLSRRQSINLRDNLREPLCFVLVVKVHETDL
jgi:hypothetical protein